VGEDLCMMSSFTNAMEGGNGIQRSGDIIAQRCLVRRCRQSSNVVLTRIFQSIQLTVTQDVHSPKPMMHIANSPVFQQNLQILHPLHFHSFCFFDYDAFTQHAQHLGYDFLTFFKILISLRLHFHMLAFWCYLPSVM